MTSSPTRTARLLAWVAVFGFVVGGAAWMRVLPSLGQDVARFDVSDGLPLSFVAILNSDAQSPASLQLLKVSDPVAPPVSFRLAEPRLARVDRRRGIAAGAWSPGRGTLVGVVELRL